MKFILQLATCFGVFLLLHCRATDPLVTLLDGTLLQGKLEGNISTFRGVPFAQPPLGNLRWRPPRKWVNPNVSKVVDATKHGSACMQFFWGDDGAFDDGSEDCLVLNVFVNLQVAKESETPLPVAIFVHGGAYISGMSHLPLYDGVEMTDFWNGKGILVTTNYRLNAFGFLGSDALRYLDEERGSTGNYGLQDQRMAFEWVRENIAAFGGDSTRVTIFGESAGAGSMSAHLTMPRSIGLYSGVVMESGAFGEWTAVTLDCAESNFAKLLNRTGCEDVACLQAKDATVIKRASELNSIDSEVAGCSYAAVVDGVELTTHPWIALSEGQVADVPIMLGTNSDEGAIFTTFPHDGDADQLNTYWKDVSGYSDETIATLTDLYIINKSYDTSFASTYWWAAERTWGDEDMSCPTEYVSQQLGQQVEDGTRKSPLFLYHFEHLPRSKDVLARHVSEIPYVFHQSELLEHQDDMRMAAVMTSWWGNFFATQSPNSGEMGLSRIPKWEAYTASADNVMVIRTAADSQMSVHLKREECAFYIPFIDQSVRSDFGIKLAD